MTHTQNKPTNPSISLRDMAKRWDLSKWPMECKQLSPEQLVDITSLASPEEDSEDWKEKLHVILASFPPNYSLESFGRSLTVIQLLEVLQFLASPVHHLMSRQQLSSLFVGVPPLVFRDLISSATDQQLYFLKEEAITEVVQHHLSLIVHELSESFKMLGDEVQLAGSTLDRTNLEELNAEEITDLYQNIDKLSEKAAQLLNLASRSLIIAWNSNRIDFIQELGRTKELCQRCLLEYIGQISEHEPSMGLRQQLEKKINTLFSDRDALGHISYMKDTTPALEALVKFSIWHVHNYDEIGLLPELNCCSTQAEAKNLRQREELLAIAEKNLAFLGLCTLKDLKAERIFSKRSLIEYINAKKAFL